VDADPMLVDVPVKPLDQLHTHVVSVKRNGLRPVEVRISARDANHKSLPELTVGLTRIHRVGHDAHAESYSAKHGDILRLAPGPIEVSGPSQMLSRLLKKTEVTLGSVDRELVVEFTQPLRAVRFSSVEFTRGDCDVIAWGEIRGDRASCRVSDGADPRLWMPPGRYTVSLERFGKVPHKQAFEVLPGNEELVVAMPHLRHRK